MKRLISALVVVLLLTGGCASNEDKSSKPGATTTSSASTREVPPAAKKFCRTLVSTGGGNNAIRPIPFHLDRDTMLSATDRSLKALGGQAPPQKAVAKHWKSLRQFFQEQRRSIAALPKTKKFPAARAEQLSNSMRTVFSRHGVPVVNYVMHTCQE